ncbi:MAG: SDR family NAD(P)-dependent oxidoreductase, partial [Bdellovibrionales bacterium]|nr:SDR family NAD(P)-dependent oxidoreductase [Bdellovibrionales bacterium]
MKFLVTGANGFIGSNLVRRIVERGDEAVALVRARSDLSLLKDVAATLCRGDILDAASLDRAMEGVDVVVHVAGLASDWGPYQSFHDVNVTGTKNVMESAMKCGVKRVVLISSTASSISIKTLIESSKMVRESNETIKNL